VTASQTDGSTPAEASSETTISEDLLDTPEAGGLVIRGGALRLASYVSVVALSALSAALLTRHLGKVRFGEYTTVISLVSVISSITDAGMSALGTREYTMRSGASRDELMRDLLGLRITLTLVGVVLATAFGIAAGYAPALLAGTVIASLSVVALVIQHTFSIPLTTSLRMGFLSALEIARQAATVVLFVVLIELKAGVLPLLAVTLAVNLMLIPPTAMVVRGQISMRIGVHLRRWLSLLRLTVTFSLASAANTIYLYAAQILTSLIASGNQSGVFAASFRVFIVTAMVPGTLVVIALPVFARAARDDPERLRYGLQRTFDVSVIIGAAAALGIITGARFIIAVVAGPHYAAAAGALRIEGLALFASFVLAGWGMGLVSLHRHRELLFSNLVALVVSATLTILLARADGARGAALASACGEAVLAILYLAGLVHSDSRLRPQLGVAAKALLATAPAIAIWLAFDLPSVLQPLVSLALFSIGILALKALPTELWELLPGRLRRAH
jgi:O-antigen/teichoic acid export membrane protein